MSKNDTSKTRQYTFIHIQCLQSPWWCGQAVRDHWPRAFCHSLWVQVQFGSWNHIITRYDNCYHPHLKALAVWRLRQLRNMSQMIILRHVETCWDMSRHVETCRPSLEFRHANSRFSKSQVRWLWQLLARRRRSYVVSVSCGLCGARSLLSRLSSSSQPSHQSAQSVWLEGHPWTSSDKSFKHIWYILNAILKFFRSRVSFEFWAPTRVSLSKSFEYFRYISLSA